MLLGDAGGRAPRSRARRSSIPGVARRHRLGLRRHEYRVFLRKSPSRRWCLNSLGVRTHPCPGQYRMAFEFGNQLQRVRLGGEALRIGAPLLHASLRALLLGTLLVAAWMIFGATSAHAAGPLPSLTGNEALPGSDAETLVGAGPLPSPVAALSESSDTPIEPLTPAAPQVIETALVPMPTAGSPATAPVTSVVAQSAPVATPVTGLVDEAPTLVTVPLTGIVDPVLGSTEPVLEVLAPVIGVTDPVIDLVAPVVDPAITIVKPVVGSVTVPHGDGGSVAVPPAPSPADEVPSPALGAASRDSEDSAATPGPVRSESAPVLVDAAGLSASLQRQTANLPVSSAPSSYAGVGSPSPARGLPPAPGPASPATPPAGSGSSLRAQSDAGSAFADLAVFQFSFTHSSADEALQGSEELPGSVSLERGFSPD